MRVSPKLWLGGLALAVAVGCGKPPPPTYPPDPVTSTTSPNGGMVAIPLVVGPQADTRTYWGYTGGHFAQGTGDTWFEHNEEAQKARGKPWDFRETARTAEHVELYDASRGVRVRLTASEMQARWDKDGQDAEWKTLRQGKWGRPE